MISLQLQLQLLLRVRCFYPCDPKLYAMIRLFSLVLGSGLKPPTGRPSSFQSKGAGGDFCRRMGAGRGHAPGGKGTDGPRKAILLATLVLVSSLYSLFLIFLYWGIRRSNFCMCKPHLNEWEDVVAMKRERGRVSVRCSLFIPFSAGWLFFSGLNCFDSDLKVLANRPSQTIESLNDHPEIL